MASGIDHEKAYNRKIAASVPILRILALSCVALLFVDPLAAVVSILIIIGYRHGLIVGKYITSDIDMVQVTREEGRLLDLWKPLGRLWIWLWIGYAKENRHRGISHLPVIGTFGRFRRVAIVPILLTTALIAYDVRFVVALFYWYGVFVGQSAQDIVHLHLDEWKIM